ncbi:hypothetical protein JCM10512_4622 [Bacteroides reticulotermitis JCM 10512]|uniref:Uncharacterized protein n=1 Tax=Bacteroides reticulotermitis JCM 10512 TaxID=1445607 RepID=W4UZ79_9BACE|nr:hypothetical protein JCM10512_4622 [Bacteroides reticulotermitis JCM 10512]
MREKKSNKKPDKKLRYPIWVLTSRRKASGSAIYGYELVTPPVVTVIVPKLNILPKTLCRICKPSHFANIKSTAQRLIMPVLSTTRLLVTA